ncbi:MAG TPA: hypothetical protein VK027_06320 [Chitinophagaceae bacterium]|nr:hypothetical protein [Chitinophagaceae bacterium]
MITLNDSLRAEFKELLQEKEYQAIIENKKLDNNLILKTFEILLKEKRNFNEVNKGRTNFQNFILNTIKS